MDLRGGGVTSLASHRLNLDKQLAAHDDDFVVMISDVHLDRPIVCHFSPQTAHLG
jgi:hypothetical protein